MLWLRLLRLLLLASPSSLQNYFNKRYVRNAHCPSPCFLDCRLPTGYVVECRCVTLLSSAVVIVAVAVAVAVVVDCVAYKQFTAFFTFCILRFSFWFRFLSSSPSSSSLASLAALLQLPFPLCALRRVALLIVSDLYASTQSLSVSQSQLLLPVTCQAAAIVRDANSTHFSVVPVSRVLVLKCDTFPQSANAIYDCCDFNFEIAAAGRQHHWLWHLRRRPSPRHSNNAIDMSRQVKQKQSIAKFCYFLSAPDSAVLGN